ncbi:MAG: GH32 C-terminal domain-containing protein, partial [Candidatus Neomarinimicrobiota bacterium]
EIFANGRQCITQRVYPTRSDSRGIEVFSSGGLSFINNLRVWDMSTNKSMVNQIIATPINIELNL